MPHYKEPEKLTPWAQVLTDFMWNQRSPRRPPLTVPQLAIRLGMPRQNVGAWVYRNVVPGFEIMMAVLARLHIPLRTLYDAYVSAGLPMPAWDVQEVAEAEVPEEMDKAPDIPRRRRQTAFPVEETERRKSTLSEPSRLSELPATEPLPYTSPPASDPARESAEEWDQVIAQTAKSLRDAGMSPQAIAGAIAALRARQSGALPEQPNTTAGTAQHQPLDELLEQAEQPKERQENDKEQRPRAASKRS